MGKIKLFKSENTLEISEDDRLIVRIYKPTFQPLSYPEDNEDDDYNNDNFNDEHKKFRQPILSPLQKYFLALYEKNRLKKQKPDLEIQSLVNQIIWEKPKN